MPDQIQATRYHFHGQVTDLVREETFQGRPYLVTPVVAVREKVLGGEFLPAEEIQASAERWLWDGVPITVHHPEKHGEWASAGLLDQAEKRQIGTFRNVKVGNDGALRGEIWIDLEVESKIEGGEEVVEILRNSDGNPTLEVSTGYWARREKKAGKYDGETFSAVQRDLDPDHLAVLPWGTGKCSLADGCGAPRLNEDDDSDADSSEGEDTMGDRIRNAARRFLESLGMDPDQFEDGGDPDPEDNQVSDDDRREILRFELQNQVGSDVADVFIREVFSDQGFVVYEIHNPTGGSGLFRSDFEIDEEAGEISLGEAVEVREVSTYEPVEQEAGDSTTEGATMDREAVINRLADCEECPFDREALEELSDERLEFLSRGSGTTENDDEPAGQGDEPAEPEDNAGDGDASDEVTLDRETAENLTALSALVDEAGGVDAVREAIEGGASVAANSHEEKQNLVARMVANDRCPWGKDDLMAQSLGELRKRERVLFPGSFTGAGGPRSRDTGGNEEPSYNANERRATDGIFTLRGNRAEKVGAGS